VGIIQNLLKGLLVQAIRDESQNPIPLRWTIHSFGEKETASIQNDKTL